MLRWLSEPVPLPISSFDLSVVECFSRLFTRDKNNQALAINSDSPRAHSCRTNIRILKREARIPWAPRRCTASGMECVNVLPGPLEGLSCGSSSTCRSVLQVLISQRPAYQKLNKTIRSIAAVAMPTSSRVTSSIDAPQVNEKHEAWLEQSYQWWRMYGSVKRAWSLLFHLYSSNAVAW